MLLSGIHLMRTGEVEANIVTLNEHFGLPYIPELIAQKREGYEQGTLAAGHGLDFFTREYEKLMAMLAEESERSALPHEPLPSAKAALNDLLLRLREL